MQYGFFGENGRIESAHNDDTVQVLPEGAIALTDEHWNIRFDLILENGQLSINPLPPAVIPEITKFTPLEFLDRFTEQEQLAVVEATMTSAPVKLWYDRLLAASFVDLNDDRTPAGLEALVSAGLITEMRMHEVLGTAG